MSDVLLFAAVDATVEEAFAQPLFVKPMELSGDDV